MFMRTLQAPTHVLGHGQYEILKMQICVYPWEGGIHIERQIHCSAGKASRDPSITWDRPDALPWGDTGSHCFLVWFVLSRWGLLTVHCAGRCQCGALGKGERTVPRRYQASATDDGFIHVDYMLAIQGEQVMGGMVVQI